MSTATESPRPRTGPRLATGAAWFFIVFSLAYLTWAVGATLADPATAATLYEATYETASGLHMHRAPGLTYQGLPGLGLAVIQLLLVGGATLASVIANPRWRRLGHRALVIWSGVWMANLLYLATLDPSVAAVGQAGLMTALFACTAYRAARRPVGRARPVSAMETPGAQPSLESPIANTAGPATTPRQTRIRRIRDAGRRLWTGRWGDRARRAAKRAAPVARTAAGRSRQSAARLAALARPPIARGARAARRSLQSAGLIPWSSPTATADGRG